MVNIRNCFGKNLGVTVKVPDVLLVVEYLTLSVMFFIRSFYGLKLLLLKCTYVISVVQMKKTLVCLSLYHFILNAAGLSALAIGLSSWSKAAFTLVCRVVL